ncbi:MAG: BamA/TamA family outer membrane protein [Ginsengibacter sp.]
MKSQLKLLFPLPIALIMAMPLLAQDHVETDSTPKLKIASAGPQYKRSKWHNFFWGKNYRKEWSTDVPFPVFFLDSIKGGVTPAKLGGGHQTTSLHLETKDGKNYTLRSVDKKLGKVLPGNFLGTFIERQVNDEVSMSHPYAAVTVPLMAQSAGIYHTNPQFVYLPKQVALDSFNDLANHVYLFEQRPKGDWRNADNLGNFEKFYDTEEVMEALMDETENHVDQAAFVKARLFDMMLGDWDRHEEQWKWGMVENGNQKTFEPVPQDRDQVYFKHNGLILDAAIFASNMNYFQSFKNHISNINTYNYEERGLDRLFTNQLQLTDWQNAAKQLQQSLTDEVIENSVKKLPQKIFDLSGKHIIDDLELRRNQLWKYATKYYLFLSKEVEIVGTKGSDYFVITRLNNQETTVNVYNITNEGDKRSTPYFSRTFLTNETKEIRLFGLSGHDVYTTEGIADNGIKIRIIGGYDEDSIFIKSLAGHRTKTYIYDDSNNYISSIGKIKKYISNDSDINKYTYRSYMYDKRGAKPSLFYSDVDRVYVGLNYGWEHHHWRKLPFVFKQMVGVNYSISQKALSFNYKGVFPNTIGKWNLSLLGNYDVVRWANFYGLGNETILTTKDKDFNRMRTKEGSGSIGFNRNAGNNFIELRGFYQSVKIINDNERYTAKNIAPTNVTVFDIKKFTGVIAGYKFSKLNDSVVPTKGVNITAAVSYTQNINQSSRTFWKYGGNLQMYIPLVSKFSLAVSGGATTVSGSPEFYQYPCIGGGQDLRGFQRQRFYGKTVFYNSNELRYISKVRSYLFNGKAGLLAFIDDGRVWMPSEKSNLWHTGYGGGIVLAPFNFIFVDITYGFSKEDNLLQFRLNMAL